MIQDGSVTVNGKNVKSNYKLNAGDIIAIHVPEVKEQEIAAEDIPLDILYEDEDIIVVKQAKGNGCTSCGRTYQRYTCQRLNVSL